MAVNKPAVIEPLIKLIPMMKLIGKFTVSDNIKLTFFLLELFCIPIIKIRNKETLKKKKKSNFFNGKDICILIPNYQYRL